MGSHKNRVGAAAISVLATEGSRGFTHRAVDRQAGVPEGTTSRYARTRAALLTAEAMFDIDAQEAIEALTGHDPGPPHSRGSHRHHRANRRDPMKAPETTRSWLW